MAAIYANSAVRSFKPDVVDRATVDKLLDAAVQAPTAMHLEPWAFAVIQDKDTLKRLSNKAKEILVQDSSHLPSGHKDRLLARAKDPEVNLFYNAATLIVIYGKPLGPFVAADCWLAAENLLLAARAMGLGACVIGLSLKALNAPEWKEELGVPADVTAHVAIIVGVPDGEAPPKSRKPPVVLAR
jgi:nitroreductase